MTKKKGGKEEVCYGKTKGGVSRRRGCSKVRKTGTNQKKKKKKKNDQVVVEKLDKK